MLPSLQVEVNIIHSYVINQYLISKFPFKDVECITKTWKTFVLLEGA